MPLMTYYCWNRTGSRPVPDKPRQLNGNRGAEQWTLIRNIAVLQMKLIVDGVRDVVLVPVSLFAGIVSLAKSDCSAGNEFYRVMRLGKKSERWINLFGAADLLPESRPDTVKFPDGDIDAMVSRVENFVIDEYRKGGVTKQAKERLDKAIASLHKLALGKRRQESSED